MLNYDRAIFRASSFTLVSLVLLPVFALANAEQQGYEMRVYTDQRAGREVISGDYSEAISLARRDARRHGETGLMANTTLCVAYTKTRRFDEAQKACSDAVARARDVNKNSSIRLLSNRTDEAIALTNRGVLRAVRGNESLAAKDFRQAGRYSRSWSAPDSNLAYLEASSGRAVAMNEKKLN